MASAPVEWITDFELAETLLRHKGFREVTFKGLVPLLGHVIVTLEGQAHRQRRTLAGKLFYASTLQAAEQSFAAETIRQLITAYSGEADLVRISYHVMACLASRTLGLDELENPQNAVKLVQLLSALVSGRQTDLEHNPQQLTRRQARDELRHSFIDRAVTKRRNLLALHQAGRLSNTELPSDLIILLLRHAQQFTPPLDTRQIAGEVAFFAVAAIDTTATLVPHIFHELWHFLERQPRYYSRLADPAFLSLCAAEAARLHPAIPTIFRQAEQDVEIPNFKKIAAGTTVGIYVKHANLSPAIFGANAAEFNPLRIVRAKTRRSGLTFGGGAHLCLGRELATGTPETPTDENVLYGQAALLVHALLEKGIKPHPAKSLADLNPFERDVYTSYPVIFP